MKTKIILGGGLSGLIIATLYKAAYYDVKIITNGNSNQLSAPFSLGPRILQSNEQVKEFLKLLNLKAREEVFSVGYFYDDQVHNTIPEDLKNEYQLKTRGNLNVKETMSGNKQIIAGYDMATIGLYQRLYEMNLGNICNYNIDIDKIKVEDGKLYGILNEEYNVEDVISTIPLERYQNLKDVVYTRVKEVEYDTRWYDYVYFPECDHKFNRLTSCSNGDIIIESNKPISPNHEYVILKTQITEELNLTDYKGIQLIGRYAQMNHSVRADTIIADFYEGIYI